MSSKNKHMESYVEPGVYLAPDDLKDPRKSKVVSSFIIPNDYITMGIGDTDTIDYIVMPDTAPNKKVVWTTEKEGIEIDKYGLITAHGVGLYVVKGETVEGGLTDSIIVNVVYEIAKTDISGVDFCSVK